MQQAKLIVDAIAKAISDKNQQYEVTTLIKE
jgi:hypothetical protein